MYATPFLSSVSIIPNQLCGLCTTLKTWHLCESHTERPSYVRIIVSNWNITHINLMYVLDFQILSKNIYDLWFLETDKGKLSSAGFLSCITTSVMADGTMLVWVQNQ